MRFIDIAVASGYAAVCLSLIVLMNPVAPREAAVEAGVTVAAGLRQSRPTSSTSVSLSSRPRPQAAICGSAAQASNSTVTFDVVVQGQGCGSVARPPPSRLLVLDSRPSLPHGGDRGLARKAVAATLASRRPVHRPRRRRRDCDVGVRTTSASAAQASHIESRESLLEQSLAGSVSLSKCSRRRRRTSRPIPRSAASLPQYVASISASGSSSGEDSGIAYAANATATRDCRPPPRVASRDNLTVVAPFAGGIPGALDLQAELERQGGRGLAGSVSLSRGRDSRPQSPHHARTPHPRSAPRPSALSRRRSLGRRATRP